MLLGGKWGNGWHCPICNSSNSGARLKCLNCEYKTPQYTGNAMMGIATLHKSNSVPVFTQEDAIEISRMRRG